MILHDASLDGGKGFDWGRVASDYARYRDIYPVSFYQKILDLGLCQDGQTVLDLGTGTGVLPRNLYAHGAKWIGSDISEGQIREARRLSTGMAIAYRVQATEDLDFPDNAFDVITACQCFFYFDHERVAPNLHRMLKPNGTLLVLYMAWLPYEDDIAGKSEALVLKYSPAWSGAGETPHPIHIPDCYRTGFDLVRHEVWRLDVPFTRETWHGRMKACRGVGASLSTAALSAWEADHLSMLSSSAPPSFTVKHYAALTELRAHPA